MAEPKPPVCLARLTNWAKSRNRVGDIGPYASYLRVCKNIPKEGYLCEECLGRSLESKNQSSMIHGILTERIPDNSFIYGGTRYWMLVEKHGETKNTKWLEQAKKAQEEGESLTKNAWKIKRLEKEMLEEMLSKKVASKKSSSGIPEKKVQNTILSSFSPVTVAFVESEKQPVMLQTDSCIIISKIVDNKKVWISEKGHMFSVDSKGEPEKFLGFTHLEEPPALG